MIFKMNFLSVYIYYTLRCIGKIDDKNILDVYNDAEQIEATLPSSVSRLFPPLKLTYRDVQLMQTSRAATIYIYTSFETRSRAHFALLIAILILRPRLTSNAMLLKNVTLWR